MVDTEEQWVAPYIAFRTVTDIIEKMGQTAPPPQIDRSYLTNYSSGYRTQIIAALAALGLIGADGTIDKTLRDMIAGDEAERKRLMAGLIERHYSDAVALSKVNATTKQLEDLFAQKYGLLGNTKAKGIAFFLKACEWAGVAVSPHFRTPKMLTTTRRKKPAIVNPPDPQPPGGDSTGGGQSSTTGKQYVVPLESGGEVQLSIQMDVFTITERDRAFVFGLVDWVRRYESQEPLDEPDEAESEGGEPMR